MADPKLGVAVVALGLVGAGLLWRAAPGNRVRASEDELAFLIREGRLWVAGLRDEHRPQGRSLEAEERRAIEGFFADGVLEGVRIRRIPEITNPEFFSFFDETGRPPPIDFRRARAMALNDTVIVVESRAVPGTDDWLELLFHELVHVVQFAVLGEERYFEEYVRGWAAAGESYRGIPLEKQAYSLAARFDADPDIRFPVVDEVRRLLEDSPVAAR